MRVALTFDIEPAPEGHPADAASRILDALAERGVAATFFVQAQWAEQHPELAARLGAEGHRVANHTYSHALPGAIGADELREEIARAEEVLERHTGQSPRPYFRCPQSSGAFDPEVLGRIAEQGYRQVGWTFDSFDWHGECTAQQLTESVVEGVRVYGDGAVVLLHSWPGATAEALPGILDTLLERGVEFVTLDELDEAALPVATVMPAGPPLPGHDLGVSTLWGLASKLATVAANFLIGVMIARALGPEGKGGYALLLQVVSVLVVVLGLGLAASNVHFVAARKVSPRAATGNSILLAAVTTVIATAACLLFIAGPLAPDPPYSLAMALVAAALFVATTLFAWLGSVAVGISGLRPQAIGAMSSVAIVFFGVFVLWRVEALTPLAAIALGVVGQLVAVTLVLFQERRRMLPLAPKPRGMAGMLAYSAKSYVVDLVGYLHLRVDILLLGWLTNPATVGVYSVAVSVAEIARYVPNVVRSALFARASQLAAEESSFLSARLSRLTVAFVLLSAAVFAAVAPVLIPGVFGEQFADAVLILYILLPGVVFISISEVPSSYLFSRGVIYWRASAVIVALNIALNLFAIPRLGAAGAALVSTATYSLFMLIIIFLMRRESDLGYREILVPTSADAAAARGYLNRRVERR